MNIVYMHQYFCTPEMNSGTRSYEMARRLVARGHRVDMITSDREATGSEWRTTQAAGIHVHWYPVAYSNKMGYSQRIKAFFQFAWHAARRAKKLQADLIFASSTPLTIALPAVSAARKHGIPMVLELRDLWPEVPIALGALRSWPAKAGARWLERYAYRNSERIVALTHHIKEGAIAQGFPASKVAMIPNVCDFKRFDVDPIQGQRFREQHDWLGNRPLVVYTGALGMVNGTGYLARLAAAVRNRAPEIRFLLVGGGREEETVREEARKLGVLNENFFMIPAVPKKEIPAILSAATVATSTVINLPEVWADSANKVFDCLASGRPIVLNHEGWLADRIREYDCGLILHHTDVEQAANELVPALEDARWVRTAGHNARQLGREYFDADKLCDQLEDVLFQAAKVRLTPRSAAA